MSSQPAEHSAWRVPEHRPLSFEQLPAFAPQTTPRRAAAGFRKRQYRFSVRADIDLLKLVVQHNPYGAPHGGRLHKWHAIADTLRDAGIDIDFRRARDRTALLLDQWRDQDLSLLRRSGSGNQEDQAEKEHLLEQISTIEQAAKPRDNGDWRRTTSDVNSRMRMHNLSPPPQPPPHSQHPPSPPPHGHPPPPQEPPQTLQSQKPPLRTQMPSLSENVDQQPLNVIASAPLPKYGGPSQPPTFSGAAAAVTSHHGHLPPLVQNHDPVLPQTRGETELHSLPFAAAVAVAVDSNPAHHPEKLLKSNDGKRLSPRFSQAVFGVSPSPHPNPMPLPAHSTSERRSPPQRAADLGTFRSELPVFRGHQSFRNNSTNTPALGSGPLDVNAVTTAVPSSPRIGEGQNIQLDPLPSSMSRQNSDPENAQIRSHLVKLERILEDTISVWKRRMDLEEKRINMERDVEHKKLQLEKERITKEFEDRKEEREERRRREDRDNEERERLLKIILRNQEPDVTEGGESNAPD